jgi:hypothetical protein
MYEYMFTFVFKLYIYLYISIYIYIYTSFYLWRRRARNLSRSRSSTSQKFFIGLCSKKLCQKLPKCHKLTMRGPFLFFFITVEARTEWCKGLWAFNMSPPWAPERLCASNTRMKPWLPLLSEDGTSWNWGLLPESQGQDLTLTGLCVPYSQGLRAF